MRKLTFLLAGSLLIAASVFSKEIVKPLEQNKINLFPLSDVSITGGQFKHIQDLDHQYLLTLEPDRLLSWFYREAGLTPKAQPYPFWESENVWGGGPLAGHIMGFYLSSMSMMYQTTHDPRIPERLQYTLNGLKECQEAHGDGYLLATINGKYLFDDVTDLNFQTSNPLINRTWEPVYIMNKIMLGLYNAYILCGLEEAKPILTGMADWFGYQVIDKLDHENMQKLLVCEHGSINESYIDVYAITGDKKYLEWAGKLNDEDMWVPLSQGKDVLNGWHANTQIPKFTGFNAVYRYTGNKDMYNAARLFWDIVVNKHTWVNGGNSTGEHFFEESVFEQKLPQHGGPESCNSVNMMRLTEALYQTDGNPERVDYYEKVLYNHILANYDPEQGMCVYFTSMRPGHYKIYGTPYDSFWCCTGTGFEAPAKFSRMIYAWQADILYVNMFIPSTLNWKEKNVRIIQDTRFPDENVSRLTVSVETPTQFTLHIRKPGWVTERQFIIKVNGKKVTTTSTGEGYIPLSRVWQNNDYIEISFTPRLELETLKSSHKYYAATYGPIVLGTPVANNNLEKTNFRHERKTVADIPVPMSDAPVWVGTPAEIKRNIKKVNSNQLGFTYSSGIFPEITLIPYNRIHFNRYSIYMACVKDLPDYKKTIHKREVVQEATVPAHFHTLDRVLPGNPSSEKNHRIETVSSTTGMYDGKNWRAANNGGYFTYNLLSSSSAEQSLYLEFLVSDQDEVAFDLLIDGRKVKTILHNAETTNLATTPYRVIIPLPKELTKNKQNLTVKIHAHRQKSTGNISGIRLIQPCPES